MTIAAQPLHNLRLELAASRRPDCVRYMFQRSSGQKTPASYFHFQKHARIGVETHCREAQPPDIIRPMRNVVLIVIAACLLAACATQPPDAAVAGSLPGFFSGVLHGLIMPCSFIGSLVADVRMYAYPNGGWPYELGFLTGATMLGALFFSAA